MSTNSQVCWPIWRSSSQRARPQARLKNEDWRGVSRNLRRTGSARHLARAANPAARRRSGHGNARRGWRGHRGAAVPAKTKLPTKSGLIARTALAAGAGRAAARHWLMRGGVVGGLPLRIRFRWHEGLAGVASGPWTRPTRTYRVGRTGRRRSSASSFCSIRSSCSSCRRW